MRIIKKWERLNCFNFNYAKINYFQLPFASLSKRVFIRIHLYVFRLKVHQSCKSNSFLHERYGTRTRFETEAQEGDLAYC